jgi:hypothetical protein
MPEILWDVNEYHIKTVGYLPEFYKHLKLLCVVEFFRGKYY